MRRNCSNLFLLICLGSCGLVWPQSAAAQASQQPQPLLRDYTRGPSWFPAFFRPYQEEPLAPLALENSPRLRELIHDGKLELSLADALALALENNLDIAVERYRRPIAQSDVLRTRAGQAARGVPNALVPSGLNVGAIGAGVNQVAGAGGLGSAGGISGGGGALQLGPVGTFDPAVSFGFSWDRVTAPLNSVQVSGVPNVTTYATAFSGSYTQLLPDGSSYFLSISGLRQSSTQQFLRFNPAVVSRFSLGFIQPLFNGFGMLPNERFLLVARNNLRTSEEVFRQQVTNTVVQVENAYWDLAGQQENIRVAEQSLAVARQLYEDNQKRVEIGTMAPLDVVSARAEMAARERDLVVARTSLQLQETRLKNLLSKRASAELDAARILLADQMPQPNQADIPDLERALETAQARRPDLLQAQQNLQNQRIAVRFTLNGLRPNVTAFGLYAGSGLEGNTLRSAAGASDSLRQAIGGDFPEYGSGLSLSLPLRNRAAQADHLRAQLEAHQLEVSIERSHQQVALEVRQAIIGLIQGKAQAEAAREAVRLARETLEAERKKLEGGISTSYNVILRERDLVAAQLAEVNAVAGYAKALVEMDRSTGTTLERNGIQLDDALSGTVSKRPTPPFRVPGFTPGQEQ